MTLMLLDGFPSGADLTTEVAPGEVFSFFETTRHVRPTEILCAEPQKDQQPGGLDLICGHDELAVRLDHIAGQCCTSRVARSCKAATMSSTVLLNASARRSCSSSG